MRGQCRMGNSIHTYYFKRQEHSNVFHESLNASGEKKDTVPRNRFHYQSSSTNHRSAKVLITRTGAHVWAVLYNCVFAIFWLFLQHVPIEVNSASGAWMSPMDLRWVLFKVGKIHS